jgi:hypothetical protein
MKRKQGQLPLSDEQEQQEVQALREKVRQLEILPEQAPAAPYWSNLLVRTNERIDHVASGKAISLSWVARVAIPGVVAIVCFFVALHYYYPGVARSVTPLSSVVASLPVTVFDSLAVETTLTGPTVSVAGFEPSLMIPSEEHLAEYLLVRGDITAAVETMGEEQIEEALTQVASRQTNL